jgi:hypothetical protein
MIVFIIFALILVLPAFASQIGGYGGGDGTITGGAITEEQTKEPARADQGIAGGEEEEERRRDRRRSQGRGGDVPNPEGAEVPPTMFTDPSRMPARETNPARLSPEGVDEDLILSGIEREGPVNPADGLVRRPNRRGAPLGPAIEETVLLGKTKPIVRYDTIYNFQNSDFLIGNPSSNLVYQQRHNDYIADLVRRMTMRLWYGYGWSSPVWGIADSNRPMFGYFPVTNNELKPELIESDMKEFYTNFSNNALAFGDRGLNIYDNNYFDFMVGRPAPLIYISDFAEERNIFRDIQSIACEEAFGPRPGLPADEDSRLATPQPGTFDVDEEVAEAEAAIADFGIFPDGVPNIEINHWRRTLVTIKKFNSVLLEPRLADVEVDFRSIAGVVEQFLGLYEVYTFGNENDECFEKPQTVRIPKRYYDYNFQVPMLDEQVQAESNYNGYFSSIYETAVDINNTPLILSPLFPNIYIIDFANTTVEEYHKLLSLGGVIEDFPGRLTEEYQNLFDDFRYANTDEYIRMWARGLARGIEEEYIRLVSLAMEYRKLIFSNYFKEEYKIISETGRRQTQFNNSIDFNVISENNLFNSIFNEIANEPGDKNLYDPIVHLASDTQMTLATVPGRQLFAEPHLVGPLPSEYIRREDLDRENSNASTSPNLMEKKQDLSYVTNNVWNLHEWFDLYCIPDFTSVSDVDWGCFYRTFPEQEAMLHRNIETFVLDRLAANNKAVPVGAIPQPPQILVTPDGDRWGECYGIEKFIFALTDLYSKLNEKITETNFRTYQEVVDGKLAYSETLFYRLERRPKVQPGAPGGETLVTQNFFLPASLVEGNGEVGSGFSYIDAQIHYGVEYEYDLYGYHFVLGNEYWYEVGKGEEETSLEVIEGAAAIRDALRDSMESRAEEREEEAAAETARCQDIIDSYSPHNFFDENRGPVRDFDENGCPYNFFDADGRLHVVVDSTGVTTRSPYNPDEAVVIADVGEFPPEFIDYRGNLQIIDERQEPLVGLEMFYFIGTYESSRAGNSEAIADGGRYYQKVFEGFSEEEYTVRIDPATGRELGPGESAVVPGTEREETRTRTTTSHIRHWYRKFVNPLIYPESYYSFEYQLASEVGDLVLYEIKSDLKFRKVFEIVDHTGNRGSQTPDKPLPEEIFNLVDYTFPVNNRPHLALVETRAFSSDVDGLLTKVVDSPPLPPDIDIVSYRSTKDKVLHMLNGNVGNYVDRPIIIEPGDFQKFKDIIVNQNITLDPRDVTRANIEEDFDINFKTDDYPELFEIFRIDFEPRSYRDFARGRKIVLDNTARMQSTLAQRTFNRANEEYGTWREQVIVTSNSIVDRVVPNKKYWYTFRVVDIHDNISNPSGILQFEMVDTGNSIFPMIEEYTFPKPEVNYVKNMRRYLKISPASNQTELSSRITNADDFYDKHPSLGEPASEVSDGSVWGKNYKLRLTSKLTGKKVDINFTFEQAPIDDRRGE